MLFSDWMRKRAGRAFCSPHPVELVGVGAVLAANDEGGVDGFGQGALQRVLVHLGGIAERVLAAGAADVRQALGFAIFGGEDAL